MNDDDEIDQDLECAEALAEMADREIARLDAERAEALDEAPHDLERQFETLEREGQPR